MASQWLEETAAYAEQQYLICQEQRKQHMREADNKADFIDKNSFDNKYSITDNSETATMSRQTHK